MNDDGAVKSGPALAAAGRPPILIADHPALDFLNSRARPDGVDVEWLTDLAALRRWVLDAGLADEQALALSFAENAGEAIVAKVVALREWMRDLVVRHARSPLAPFAADELEPLNRLLVEDRSYRELILGEGRPTWSAARFRSVKEALIQSLTHAIGDLFSTADFSRIRQCEGEGCTLWFLDLTKNGTRRWCDMAICGNRAKVKAHRARARQPPP